MDEDNLFIPDDVSDLLEVSIPIESTDSEYDNMLLVNSSAQSFLSGETPTDCYLDILDSVGIDPVFHLQEAVWQIAKRLNF